MSRGRIITCLAAAALLWTTAGCPIAWMADNTNTNGNGNTNSNGNQNGNNSNDDDEPDPTPEDITFSFDNGSSSSLSLSFRAGGGGLQTISLGPGQQFVADDLTECDCFTVLNFTPPASTEVEGFSIATCDDATVAFANAPGPFGGVSRTLSGGGDPGQLVTFALQNESTRSITIFPFVNGQVSASFTLAVGLSQTLSVNRCERLRVVGRDPANSFADVEFIESPATEQATYTYRDTGVSQIEVVKEP